jgi:hypothetical protein
MPSDLLTVFIVIGGQIDCIELTEFGGSIA